jgi:trehalose 6-phosphate phosphatase
MAMNLIDVVERSADLILLDLDGTVIDIAERPDQVVVEPAFKTTLQRLQTRDPLGLVLVTGRALAVADELLHPLRLNSIASHGAECRVARTLASPTVDPIAHLRPGLEELARLFDEATVEWKPFSVAIHFRLVPHLSGPLYVALSAFIRANPGYRIQDGRHVFEIVPNAVSKAEAVRRLLRHLPYAARRPVYIGDDSADSDAMSVVEGHGGWGLRVAGEYFASLDANFESPAAVREWLLSLVGSQDRQAGGATLRPSGQY